MKFKYDLHVHTKEVSACARLSMEEIIDEYIKEGYAGLIITDHFRKGYFRKCKDEKEKRDSQTTRAIVITATSTNIRISPKIQKNYNENDGDNFY